MLSKSWIYNIEFKSIKDAYTLNTRNFIIFKLKEHKFEIELIWLDFEYTEQEIETQMMYVLKNSLDKVFIFIRENNLCSEWFEWRLYSDILKAIYGNKVIIYWKKEQIKQKNKREFNEVMEDTKRLQEIAKEAKQIHDKYKKPFYNLFTNN